MFKQKQKTKKNKYKNDSSFILKKKFEDIKGVIRIRQSKKDRQHNGQAEKGQITIYKTLNRKLMIEQHRHH